MAARVPTSIDEDPRIKTRFFQGQALLKLGQYDAAIETFSRLLEEAERNYGQMFEPLAPIWYSYGDAMLEQVERNADIFDEPEDEQGQGQGQGQGPSSSEAQDNAEADFDREENLELAFAAFDVARVLFSRSASKTSQLQLARTHLRLGDLALQSAQYQSSIDEYMKCLDIYTRHLPPHDRSIADAQNMIAIANAKLATSSSDRSTQIAALQSAQLFTHKAVQSLLSHLLQVAKSHEEFCSKVRSDFLKATTQTEQSIKALWDAVKPATASNDDNVSNLCDIIDKLRQKSESLTIEVSELYSAAAAAAASTSATPHTEAITTDTVTSSSDADTQGTSAQSSTSSSGVSSGTGKRTEPQATTTAVAHASTVVTASTDSSKRQRTE